MTPSTHLRRALVLVGLVLVSAACAPSSTSTPETGAPAKPAGGPTPDPALVAQGATVIQQKGCGACHTIPGIAGATGAIGPNLAGVAGRSTIAGGTVPNNGPDDLKRWVLDPPALKPGTQMPKLNLTDEEATQVAAFLETLR